MLVTTVVLLVLLVVLAPGQASPAEAIDRLLVGSMGIAVGVGVTGAICGVLGSRCARR